MTDRHENAKEHYEERAGLLEFCAEYPRAEAERLARLEAAAWLKAHPVAKEGDGND